VASASRGGGENTATARTRNTRGGAQGFLPWSFRGREERNEEGEKVPESSFEIWAPVISVVSHF
jgi:hypothetical protein